MDFNNTPTRNSGDYFGPGKYTAELVLAKEILAGAKKETRIIFEFKVLNSTNSEDVGRKKSIAINPNDKFDYGPKDIKSILVALEGIRAEDEAAQKRVDWNKRFADAIEPSKNAYKGRVVELEFWIPEGKKYAKYTVTAAGMSAPVDDEPPTLPPLPPVIGSPLENALADGWKIHTQNEAWMYKGKDVKPKSDVLTMYS